MAKIRVYELATKLGLENKDIVDKLNQAGIEVKNHMSALEEEVALKFESTQSSQTEAAPADESVEVKVKEERIGSGTAELMQSNLAHLQALSVTKDLNAAVEMQKNYVEVLNEKLVNVAKDNAGVIEAAATEAGKIFEGSIAEVQAQAKKAAESLEKEISKAGKKAA